MTYLGCLLADVEVAMDVDACEGDVCLRAMS